MRDHDSLAHHGSVLVVITTATRRGAEIDGTRLADSLRHRGHRAEVVALARGMGPSLPVEVLGRKPLSPRTLWRLRRKAGAFDLVIAYGSTTLPACSLALVGGRRPWLYRSIGDPQAWAGGALHRWRTGLLMRRATHVVALYPAAADAIAAMYSVARARLSTIPNDRSADAFTPPSAQQRSDARSALDIADGVSVVCFVGALSAEKRVDLAISAIAAVPSCVLVVAGDGPTRQAAEAMATRELGERVRWLGAVDDVVAVLHAADALLLTSRTEGMPGVLVEAALCGVPVVATDVGAVRQMVVDRSTGRVAETHEPDVLAAALREVLANREQMGHAALQHARERYESRVVAPAWARLLEGLGESIGRRPLN